MKTNTLRSLVCKFNACLLPVVFLSFASLTLSACQKEPETKTQAQTATQSSATTPDISDDNTIDVDSVDAKGTETEREAELTDLENNIGAEGVTPNAETTTPSPEQTIKGTQITDVQYRSDEGTIILVVFETSATGVLNAILTLPDKSKMTLSAPEGQGNNPTYRSEDGNIQLVSHGGGSTIDLMQDNKVTSFEAVSAEAEVITQP